MLNFRKDSSAIAELLIEAGAFLEQKGEDLGIYGIFYSPLIQAVKSGSYEVGSEAVKLLLKDS